MLLQNLEFLLNELALSESEEDYNNVVDELDDLKKYAGKLLSELPSITDDADKWLADKWLDEHDDI